MRLILVAFLAITLVMTGSCTTSETNPSPTTSTIASSTITVPRVVGLDVDSAKRAIEGVGLPWKLSVVTGDYVHAVVVQQDPPPGVSAGPGTTVVIVSGPA